jgi:Uri superfamily endonuclease
MHSRLFTLFGNKTPEGSYILMIKLAAPVELAFGRFRKGKPLSLPEGDYLYIGSALGGRHRHNPLPSRLFRHASRSGGKKPHAVRDAVTGMFPDYACQLKKRTCLPEKKLRWHIDYLLDLEEAEIGHIVIIRYPGRLEWNLCQLLASLEEVSVPAPRLGAQDTPDSTHLLKLKDMEKVLGILRKSIPAMLREESPKVV